MENEVTATETNEQTENTGAETKTYTFDEVQALLQSEADKRVTAALKKAEAKHQKELAKEQSLSKLDGAEREKAEKDARIAELEEKLGYEKSQRISEFAESDTPKNYRNGYSKKTVKTV